jgi:hypothetical protein
MTQPTAYKIGIRTQPDTSYQVPAHPSGLDMRTQLNVIVLAILGDNAGPSEPPETYPGMMWGDTTASLLKRRNNVNDGWITIGPLDDFLGDVRKNANDAWNAAQNKVAKTGDAMTGDLWLNDMHCLQLNTTSAGHQTIRADQAMQNGYGGAGLGMGIVNNGNTAWNFSMNDNGNYSFRGFNWGEFYCVGNNGDSNGYSSRLGPGYFKMVRYDYGPYMDFARTADQDFVWRMSYENSNDRLHFTRNGSQYIGFLPDANIYCSGRGYVWDEINNAKNTANNASNNMVTKNTGNAMYMGWGIHSSCITVNVDNAWNKNVILSDNNRWYSMCNYDSAGFIAISIDGDYGTQGNRSIVTQASDGRLKDIYGPTNVDALDAILRIPIIRYAFKVGEPEHNDGQVHEIGFDARDVQQVAPSIVYEVGEAKITHVYPNGGLALAWRAIQQLAAAIDALRMEVSRLANAIDELRVVK